MGKKRTGAEREAEIYSEEGTEREVERERER